MDPVRSRSVRSPKRIEARAPRLSFEFKVWLDAGKSTIGDRSDRKRHQRDPMKTSRPVVSK